MENQLHQDAAKLVSDWQIRTGTIMKYEAREDLINVILGQMITSALKGAIDSNYFKEVVDIAGNV
jgi:2-keto-3-deoxy-galactonokinase